MLDGYFEYAIEDNSFSYDYGEQTNLTHDPGSSIDIESVVIESVADGMGESIPSDNDMEQKIIDYFQHGDGLREVLDDAEKQAIDDEADRAYWAMKERDEL